MWLGIGQPLSMVQLKRINELIDNVAFRIFVFDFVRLVAKRLQFAWSHSNPQNCNDFLLVASNFDTDASCIRAKRLYSLKNLSIPT